MSIILRYHSVILSLIGHSSKRRPIKTINQMQCNIREEEHQDCSVLRMWYIQAVTWPILVGITGMIFWWYHYWSLGMFDALWLCNDGKKQIKAVFFMQLVASKLSNWLFAIGRRMVFDKLGWPILRWFFLEAKYLIDHLKTCFEGQFIPQFKVLFVCFLKNKFYHGINIKIIWFLIYLQKRWNMSIFSLYYHVGFF